jgi:transcriptional regulator of acetoin/glycerol metabolism
LKGLVAEKIRVAYEENHRNVTATAQTLGVSRNTVYKHLRDLGLR